MKRFITILLPVYNTEKYLNQSIESILNQTYTNFELLIIDDGSTDNSLKIIQSFDDSRIRIIRNEKNIGLIRTLNKGIDLAKGRYIARMDADDIAFPKRLEKQVHFLEQHQEYVLVGTQAKFIFKNKISDKLFKMPSNSRILQIYSLFHCPFIHPSVMIRSDILRAFRYDKKFAAAEDYELWTRILQKHKGFNLQAPLLYYRMHDSNVSSVLNNQQVKSVEEIYQRNLEYIGMPYTKKDLSTYLKVSPSYQQKISILELKEVRTALSKIQKHLICTNFENKQLIEQGLGMIWFRTCMKVSYNGFSVFKLYFFQNRLSKKWIGLQDLFFLLSKCIFPYHYLSVIYNKFLNLQSRLSS